MPKTREEKATYMRIWRAARQEECRAYREAHFEEHRVVARAWAKAHPEKNRIYNHAWRERHRDEERARSRAYWEAHPEECRAASRAWREAHPEERRVYRDAHSEERLTDNRRYRAIKRNATIGPIDLEAIKTRDQMRCCICGKRVADKDFSLDHTIPLSLGGAHSQENLRVAHRRCNNRRGAGRLPVQMVLV